MGAFGRAAFGIAGGLAGAYLTGGSPAGFAIGGMIGSIFGSLLFPVDGPDVEGPRLQDLSVQTSTYGNAIPVGYGMVRISGNIIWASPIREQAHSESTGGKGGGGSTETTYSYSVDLAIALAQGPIVGIRRVWANDKLQFNFSEPATAPIMDKSRMDAYEDELRLFSMQRSLTLYLGTETQLPDPTIEAAVGIGSAPAHRGMAYVVIKDLQLSNKDFGNRVPNFEFEVVFSGTTANSSAFRQDDPVGGSLGYVDVDPQTGYIWATRDGVGANPGQVIVLDPNDLSLIAEIEHPSMHNPYGLTYQPSYVEIVYDYLQGGMVPLKIRAHWWVGDGQPAGYIYRIDAETYQILPIATGAGVGAWPGALIFDDTYINYLKGNSVPALGRVVVTTNNGAAALWKGAEPLTAVALGCAWLIIPVSVSGAPDPIWVQDWEQGKDGDGRGMLWIVDAKSRVYKARREPSGVPLVDFLWIYAWDIPGGIGTIGDQLNRLAYDYVDFNLYTYTGEYPSGRWLTKYDSDLNEVWRIDYSGYGSVGGIAYHSGVGDVWLLRYNYGPPARMELVKIDKATGADAKVIQTDLPGFGYSDLKLYPGNPYAFVTQYGGNGGIRKIPLYDYPTPVPPTVEDVVQDISSRCGVSLANVDAGELTDTVLGYVLASQTTGRRAIEHLQQTYFFDGVESDYLLKFPARGKSPLLTIPYFDAGATVEPDKPTSPIERQRSQDTELPWHVDIRYLDYDRSYKVSTQYARRLIGNSKRVTQINMPVVLTSDLAKRVADIGLYGTWMARDTGTVFVSREYLALDPGDVISYQNEAGVIDTFLVTKTDYSIPGIIKLTVQRDDPSVYNSNAVGVTGPAIIETVPIILPTRLYLMDIPILRDQDDDAGLYYAVASPRVGWSAASIWKSADEGVSYNLIERVDRESTVGFARTTLHWEGGV